MIIAQGETLPFKHYKLKPNSAFEYEEQPTYFKGCPANKLEIRNYRVQAGVQANTESTFIKATNLPIDIKPNDRIEYLGKIWTIESVGYFYTESLITNASVMSNEYIIKRMPKGFTLV